MSIASREAGGWLWRDRVRQSAGPSLSLCECDCLSSSLFNPSNFLVKKYKEKNLFVPRQKSNHKIVERDRTNKVYRDYYDVSERKNLDVNLYTRDVFSRFGGFLIGGEVKKKKKKPSSIRKVIWSLFRFFFFSYTVYNIRSSSSFLFCYFYIDFLCMWCCVGPPILDVHALMYFHLVSARYVSIALSDYDFFFIRIVFSFVTFGSFLLLEQKAERVDTSPTTQTGQTHTHR